MENTTPFDVRRTRRSSQQWQAILAEHLDSDETPQQLAGRLGCAVSTIELQMKKPTAPDRPQRRASIPVGFVEVEAAPTQNAIPALILQTESATSVIFHALAATLGLPP